MRRRGLQTRYRVAQQTLLIDLGDRGRVLSSAPHGGGLTAASHILNHQVESDPVAKTSHRARLRSDPSRYLRRLAATLGAKRGTVGLMTAVPMTQLVTARASSGPVWVECFATVGVTNAVRAGEWPESGARRTGRATPGTINLILVTNVCLSSSAMVGAVQVATESKTGVLRDHAVPSWTGQSGATGTGTDAVVIACRLRGKGPRHAYSGTHTVIGALIGRVVARCVSRGLAKAKQWRERQA
ncbi:MAG TPA: adenosylcobinamide amidohydrolase [Nitrospira sp.]|nr:adenosylcobinamide amidohydrolase [Nitrospira sp.]